MALIKSLKEKKGGGAMPSKLIQIRKKINNVEIGRRRIDWIYWFKNWSFVVINGRIDLNLFLNFAFSSSSLHLNWLRLAQIDGFQ